MSDKTAVVCTAYALNGCAHPQFCTEKCEGRPIRDPEVTDPRYLTKTERRVMDSALRRSMQIVPESSEAERLRAALIRIGKRVGCHLSPDVSTDFLLNVPDEVDAKLRRAGL